MTLWPEPQPVYRCPQGHETPVLTARPARTITCLVVTQPIPGGVPFRCLYGAHLTTSGRDGDGRPSSSGGAIPARPLTAGASSPDRRTAGADEPAGGRRPDSRWAGGPARPHEAGFAGSSGPDVKATESTAPEDPARHLPGGVR